MRKILKGVLPNLLVTLIQNIQAFLLWRRRNYLDNSPQFIKRKIFDAYGVKNSTWIETGTFLGETTDYLRKRYPFVHTIEPSRPLCERARSRFAGANVEVHLGTSEEVMPELLRNLNGDVTFWLDGHNQDGVDFQGAKACPAEEELAAIGKFGSNFDNVTILIDDVRCFLSVNLNYDDFPSIDFLVNWARENKYLWRIEHDIFIMQRKSQ